MAKILHIKPQVGQALPTDLVSGATLAQTGGTLSLVNDPTYGYLWRLIGGYVGNAALAGLGNFGENSNLTVAFQFRVSNRVALFTRWSIFGSGPSDGLQIGNYNGSGVNPAPMRAGPMISGSSVSGQYDQTKNYTADTVFTVVVRFQPSTTDLVDIWYQTTGRSGSTPDAAYSGNFSYGTASLSTLRFTAAAGETLDILQYYADNTALTNAQCALLADDINTFLATDTTSPTLSAPTGTATGTTTASGTVSTNEANGTLYFLVSTSNTATAAAVKAGNSQSVTATGTQNVSATGLSASTLYYIHYLHRDAAGNDSAVVSSSSFSTPAPGDTTPPTLSAPTGVKSGATGATGSVTTNEGNGTLYFRATTNSTESAATVKAGSTQAVTGTGTQNVAVSGLTGSTTYYLHYVHRDAAGNDSAVASSASFTTDAPADTTPPTLSAPTSSATGSTTATVGVTTNEANGTLYRYVSTNSTESAATVKASGATTTVTASGAQTANLTSLLPSTTYYCHWLHRDAAGNDSAVSTTPSFTTQSGGATVTFQVVNNTDTGVLSTNLGRVVVLRMSDGLFIMTANNVSSNSSGDLPVFHASFVAGVDYIGVCWNADGTQLGVAKGTAV